MTFATDPIFQYLRKKPNPKGSFRLMSEWESIADSEMDEAAQRASIDQKNTLFQFKDIAEQRDKIRLLSFLRYDYKKVLTRTRFLYIDRFCDPATRILKGTDLDFAFFEPILLCFPNLEFIGRITYPDLFMMAVGKKGRLSQNTSSILETVFKGMQGGYEEHAKKLIMWHRHALSHELRPDGIWQCNLNTQLEYEEPCLKNKTLFLNIPHFIDSCILEIEKVCEALTGNNSDVVIDRFGKYVEKKFKESPNV